MRQGLNERRRQDVQVKRLPTVYTNGITSLGAAYVVLLVLNSAMFMALNTARLGRASMGTRSPMVMWYAHCNLQRSVVLACDSRA